MQFTPLKNFFSEELKSQYCVGLSYTVKPDKDHAKLAALVPKWIKQGLVRPGAPDLAASEKVTGSGEVQTIGAADVGTLKL
jgi:hypothetical protein